jgi:hypothetical protein
LAEEKFLKSLSLIEKVKNPITGMTEDVPLVAPSATSLRLGEEGEEEETEEEIIHLLQRVTAIETEGFEDQEQVIASSLLLKIRGLIAKVILIFISSSSVTRPGLM